LDGRFCCERYWQGSQASQAEIVPPDQGLRLERQVRQTPQDGFKRNLTLKTR